MCKATEAGVCEIWSRHLGTGVEAEDDFFELGGGAEEAAAIVQELEELLGRRLNPALLARASTVRQLLQSLDSPPSGEGLLVPIQVEGEMSPLFCVHPNGGHVFPFVRLSRALGPNVPVYGFRARGLVEGEAPHLSMQEMASAYIQEMRRVQPTGPYHLCGRCMGGMVAFEMARQLRQQNEPVEMLLILDSPAPDRRQSRAVRILLFLARALWWVLRNLFRPGHLARRIHYQFHKEEHWTKPGGEIKPGAVSRFQEVSIHLQGLQEASQGDPLEVDTLFVGSLDPQSERDCRKWSWLTRGRFAQVKVKTDHHSMLREPHLRQVAETVRLAMEGSRGA